MFDVVVARTCASWTYDNVKDDIELKTDDFELFDLKVAEIKRILKQVKEPDLVSQPSDPVVSSVTGT